MAYTTHGHQITGSTVDTPKPERVARCGGPGLCSQCSRESAAFANQNKSREDVILQIAAELIDRSVKDGTFAGTHTVIGAFAEASRLLETEINVGDVIDDPQHGEATVVLISQNGDAAVRYTRHSVPKFKYLTRDFILSHKRK